MKPSLLELVILVLGIFTNQALGDDDGSFKIDAESYFSEITKEIKKIFNKHTSYAVDNTQKYSAMFENSTKYLNLSDCSVEKIGEVSNGEVINELYTDPTVGSMHPAFVTTYTLQSVKVAFNYNVTDIESSVLGHGQLSLTVSGVKIFIGVAVIKDAGGTYLRFLQSYAAEPGTLSSFEVTGKKIANMNQAVNVIYNTQSQDFLNLIVKSFDIVIAQEFVTNNMKL